MTDENSQPVLDNDRQSIRGRACPQCGGKIIPSDRAIYQGTGNASDVFPLWQCERCGYEQMGRDPAAKPKPAPSSHKKG